MERGHDFYMDRALELASCALDNEEFPVGCVLVSGDEIVGQGCRINSSNASERNELDHAEILAIRDWLAKGAAGEGLTAYTTLEPCLMCFGALILHGVRRIVYAYEDIMGGVTGMDLSRPLSGVAGSGDWHPEARRHFLYKENRIEIVPGVRRQESLALFRKFFSNDANNYWKDSLLARYSLEIT